MEWTEKDVRTWKRGDRGGVVFVVVPGTSGWRSSGLTRRQAAIDWALTQANGGFSPDILFGEYAKDFFLPGTCRRVTMLEKAHGPRTPEHWASLRQLLDDYILPRWGRTMLAALAPAPIFEWISAPDLMTVREFGGRPRPVSAAQRNKIRVAFKHILDQAAFEGLIRAGLGAMVPTQATRGAPTDTYTEDEEGRLFPADFEEAVRIWGGRKWALLGMVLRDSSARPSEALALYWRDWHPKHAAFVCYQRVDKKGMLGPLKSSKKARGVKRKPLLVESGTAAQIEAWRAEFDPKPDDLVFPSSMPGQPMRVAAAGHHFVGVLKRAGVPQMKEGSAGRPRLQYSLRHGAITAAITEHGLAAAQDRAGHTPGSAITADVYDHPGDEELLSRARRVTLTATVSLE